MKQQDNSMLILSKDEVFAQLVRQEARVIEIVKQAYIQHSQKKTSLPFSSFLRFPDRQSDRIIALPAYVSMPNQEIAGLKWVASFPGNLDRGLARASASLILNDMATGRPYCFMEASLINIHRTAASAALAVKLLSRAKQESMTVIGCGPINFHVLQYVLQNEPSIKTIRIFDQSVERARDFAKKCTHELQLTVEVCTSFAQATEKCTLISFGTNASDPWIEESFTFNPETLILHVSLRDIPPRIMKSAYNVVDDASHVNRERTSIHLTSQDYGDFSRKLHEIGTLAADSSFDPRIISQPIIYSPFGLGILDIAVGKFVYDRAVSAGAGDKMINFFGK